MSETERTQGLALAERYRTLDARMLADAGRGFFFRVACAGEYGPGHRPEGRWIPLFKALAAIEERLDRLEGGEDGNSGAGSAPSPRSGG